MEWFVYCYNHAKKCVEPYNVFKHSGFRDDVIADLLSFPDDKDGFEESLRKDIQYYFWSRCEYEILLVSWPRGDNEVKVDIADQIFMNWDNFVDYVWRNRNKV